MASFKKSLINVFLGIVPSSKMRKNLRRKIFGVISKQKISFKESSINKLNNNKFLIKNGNNCISDCKIDGLNVKFIGRNSTVIIHEPISLSNCSIKIGNNSTVEIFSSVYGISGLHISATNNSIVEIKENFSCCGCRIANHDEANLKVLIGKDCMFSHGINLRVSDGHSIYKLDNSEIINKPQKGIVIGNHVWVGMNATILKDIEIPSNTVIGANSLINKSFNKENIIVVGQPAKIIKENVNWSREHADEFVQHNC